MDEGIMRTNLIDDTAEKLILGLMLSGKIDIGHVMETLDEDDFSLPDAHNVYSTMKEMYGRGERALDEVTVSERLAEKGQLEKVGGRARLINYQTAIPLSALQDADIDTYMNIVKEKSLRRKLNSAGRKLVELSSSSEANPSETLGKAELELMQIGSSVAKDRKEISEVLEESFKRLLELNAGKIPEGSITTGFHGIDDILNTINPSDFIVIGARPAMGKTALALNIMNNVAEQTPVAFFSLEMSAEELGSRMILSASGVTSEDIRHGLVNITGIDRMQNAVKKLSSAPIYIDDRSPMDIAAILSSARKLKAEKGIGLIIIDYLQLLKGFSRKDGRQQEVSDISRALKLLAREINVPIIALSQLNRLLESRNDKRPQMSDIRESGSLEQDADAVLFLYRDEYYNPDSPDKGVTEVIVSKHRKGRTGTAKLYFDANTTHFFDLAHEEIRVQRKHELEQWGERSNKEDIDAPPTY